MTDYAQDMNAQEVLVALNSDDIDIVRHAIFTAGELRLVDSVDVLCKHIQSTNIGVQEAAEYALRKIGGKQTIQKILPFLRSDSPSLRNISMDILREIGCEDITSIQPLLRDVDPDMRIFMSDILGHTKSLQAVPLLCEALLKDPEVNVRYQAAMSLGTLGYAEAVDALQKAMHDEDWVQFSVVDALVKIRAEETAGMLVQHLDHCSPLVASIIIDAIGELKNIKAVPLLLRYLEKANTVLCHKAVKAIVQILGESALSLLSPKDQERFKGFLGTALSDEDESVQMAALSGLATVGDAQSSQYVLDFILSIKMDSENDIYVAAIKTLAAIGYNDTFAAFLNSKDTKTVNVALEACELMSNAACMQTISKIFWNLDRDGQRLASRSMAKHATVEDAVFILDILERNDDSEVLKNSMLCLGTHLKYVPAQDKIFSMISHDYADVRTTAIEACIDLHTKELEAKFIDLFNSGQEEERTMALYVLCNYGIKKHFEYILKALDDESATVRQLAVESFASPEIQLHDHVDTLLKELKDPDHDVRIAVVDVFGNRQDDTLTPYLVNALDDENEWVCIRAIEALGTLKNDTIAGQLVERLQNATPMVTFKIIEVLADIGGNVAFSALLNLMSHDDLEIQHAATAAIEKIQVG